MGVSNWGQWTSPELETRLASNAGRAVAVLTLGATEQHGPHLNLDTDTTLGEQLLQTLWQNPPKHAEVFVLPSVAFGASCEHQNFTGTLSISGATLLALVTELGHSLARSSVDKLLILSAHGGNSHWIAEAALALRAEFDMLVVPTSINRLIAPVQELPDDEVAKGIHGGAVEVALARALAPRLLREEHLDDFRRKDDGAGLKAGGASGFAWLAEDLSLDGVAGNTTLGTLEVGRALIARGGANLSSLVEAIAATDWPPAIQSEGDDET